MDGSQRVMVFSMSEDIKRDVVGIQAAEHPHLDFSLSINTAILSLVNDEVGQEIATIGIIPLVKLNYV